MNTNQSNDKTKIKKRKPLVAAFLSLISMGLGQVYNGEFRKGVFLNLIFWTAFLWYGWYTVSAYFGPSGDLIFFLITLGAFLILKAYSIAQAYVSSRKKGATYRLKPVNRWFVYLLFALILLVPPLMLNQAIRTQSLRDTSPPHPFRSARARSSACSGSPTFGFARPAVGVGRTRTNLRARRRAAISATFEVSMTRPGSVI